MARGSFSLEDGLRRDVTVTLSAEEEGGVDAFELVGPGGTRHTFPVYLDG